MSRILVIEDDKRTAEAVADVLTGLNHVVDITFTGEDGLESLLMHHFDLAIVDWILPGIEGFTVCQQYRKRGGATPILFLTAERELPKKVSALDCGADDYLCKPFAVDELIARVNAILRRPQHEPGQILRSGSLAIEMNTCTVTIASDQLSLTAGEYRLLKFFMQNAGAIYSVSAILQELSMVEPESTEAGLRQMIACLRKKLSKDEHNSSIVNIKGQGYQFQRKNT